jgi:hypothetical protein
MEQALPCERSAGHACGVMSRPTTKELQAAGCESLRGIAAGLEERGISSGVPVVSGHSVNWPGGPVLRVTAQGVPALSAIRTIVTCNGSP